VSLSGSNASLMFSITVWRCSGPRMLEHDAGAHARDPVRRPAGDFGTIDAHRAGIGPLDAHDQLHHRRLTGAVRADQPQNFPGFDAERHVLDGDQAAEALGEPDTSRCAFFSAMLTRSLCCA